MREFLEVYEYGDNTDFSGTYLRDNFLIEDLSGVWMKFADLRKADLEGVCLRGSNLEGADLREANLSEADLSGAYLRGAYLSRADLREIIWDSDTIWPDGFEPPPSAP